jgi:LacI family transcriptional regulator
MRATVTGHDVARAAGVSQATVSRALRNLPGTSPATRAAVLAAAASLNYVPSDRGRVLSTRTTRRVAVVVEELTNPYYPQLVEPLQNALRAVDLQAVLVTDHGEQAGSVTQLSHLVDGSYDAVVLTTTTRDSTLPRDLTEWGMPHVLMHRLLDRAESPSCAFDNASGAAHVAALLMRLGHTNIGAIHGPVSTSSGRERAETLQATLRSHGVTLKRANTRRASVFSHECGYRLARELLMLDSRPSALVCGNDVLAFGALSAARELNIRVPDELTVIGFDDIEISSWPLVNLTTVRCDLTALAAEAVALLQSELAGSREVETRRVPVTLVERGSHAAPQPGLRETSTRRS